MTSEANNYTYAILPITEADRDNAMNFLKRTFFINEPINRGVALCQDGEECPGLEDYCLKGMLSGFSLRAVDQQGNIVGVMVSGKSTVKKNSHEPLASAASTCTDPKFRRILQLLARREREARLWEHITPGTVFLEVQVAATDPTWARRGVMTALLAHTHRLALAHDIHLIRMDTSSAYSALVADKQGYNCISRLRYADVTVDGLQLTTPPPPHVEDRVYVKWI